MSVEYSDDELRTLVTGGDEEVLRSEVLAFDYLHAHPRESALLIGRILLYPLETAARNAVKVYNRNNTPYEQWLDALRLEHKDLKADTLARWLMTGGTPYEKISLYAIFLYNRNYGQTRRIFSVLLNNDWNTPPYLDLVIINLFRQILGLSHTEIRDLLSGPFRLVAYAMNTLFMDQGGAFDAWIGSKKKKLRFYGGSTNTVLGLFDSILTDEKTGITRFNTDAEICYDLGGGFSTSEVSRLLGRDFVSADRRSPHLRQSDPELVVQEVSTTGEQQLIGTEAHAAFLDRQDRIGYQELDVLSQSFPTEAESYAIISTGFMTSAIYQRFKQHLGRYAALRVNIYAILRVMELVALGKAVDLFTLQTATGHAYKHKTCLLRWRDGRLIDLATTEFKKPTKTWMNERMLKRYERIRPDNAKFIAHLDSLD